MIEVNDKIAKVKAFAPATCANVMVGFDILGFAVPAIGDWVTCERKSTPGIELKTIISDDPLPKDSSKNTATAVIERFCQTHNLSLGLSVTLEKGIPLSSGMGGSAASAVAAITALSGFLKEPLTPKEIAEAALYGEEVATGHAHGDNIVPCAYGSLTLITKLSPLKVVELPHPKMACALVHPHMQIETKAARALLKDPIGLPKVVEHGAYLAGFIAALYRNDLELLADSMQDILVEPKRAGLIPGFAELKSAAMAEGALGASISGAGPTCFALTPDLSTAERVAKTMVDALGNAGLASDSWAFDVGQGSGSVIEQVTEVSKVS